SKPAAKIQTVAARDHDVEQEERGWLPLGIAKYLVDSKIWTDSKTCTFKMILHQAGDIRVVFQHKNRLTQFVNLASNMHMINVRLAQSGSEDCERTMNRNVEIENWV